MSDFVTNICSATNKIRIIILVINDVEVANGAVNAANEQSKKTPFGQQYKLEPAYLYD